MTERAASRLAWGTFFFIALLFIGAAWLEAVNVPPPDVPEWGGDRAGEIFFMVLIFVFPAVGVLIASRHPNNAIGWIMLGIGFVDRATDVLEGYARYGLLTNPGAVPAPDVALAFTNGSWVLVIVPIMTFLLLLFPDGRLPSKRWKPVAYLAGFAMVATYSVITIFPGGFVEVGYPDVQNPLGIDAIRPFSDVLLSVLVLIPLSALACAAGLVQRYRRSRGQLRLQMKWLAAAASIVAAAYTVAMVGSLASDLSGRSTPPSWVLAAQNIIPLTFLLIPLAMGAAILRHRLYDIDIIINKTLVYGALTATLSATYLIVVGVLQDLLGPVTGDSNLAIAVSTLAAAALFRPARARIQSFIDRRFYRKKYDSARTLESFASTMRNEVDLESLSPALIGIVQETMQPTHASLWLRPSEPDSRAAASAESPVR